MCGIGVVGLRRYICRGSLGLLGASWSWSWKLELGLEFGYNCVSGRVWKLSGGSVVGFRVIREELNRVEGFGKEERLETEEWEVVNVFGDD